MPILLWILVQNIAHARPYKEYAMYVYHDANHYRLVQKLLKKQQQQQQMISIEFEDMPNSFHLDMLIFFRKKKIMCVLQLHVHVCSNKFRIGQRC